MVIPLVEVKSEVWGGSHQARGGAGLGTASLTPEIRVGSALPARQSVIFGHSACSALVLGVKI